MQKEEEGKDTQRERERENERENEEKWRKEGGGKRAAAKRKKQFLSAPTFPCFSVVFFVA